MIFGLFFISSFQDAKAAFAAFEERGLLGKRFTSKLSKIDPVGQLSEWLVLVRLLSTLEHEGPGDLTVKANRKLAHTMIFDYEEFCVNKDDSGYEISTSAEFDRMADGILGIQKVPMAWALYEDANDAFWQMVTEYRMNVPEEEFEKEIRGIYNENCSKYLDPRILCKGTWMAIYDNKAPWPFGELDPDEEYPSFTFTFYEDIPLLLFAIDVCFIFYFVRNRINPAGKEKKIEPSRNLVLFPVFYLSSMSSTSSS